MPDDVSIHVNRGIKQVCICWGLGYSGCRDNNIADHLWNSYDPIFVKCGHVLTSHHDFYITDFAPRVGSYRSTIRLPVNDIHSWVATCAFCQSDPYSSPQHVRAATQYSSSHVLPAHRHFDGFNQFAVRGSDACYERLVLLHRCRSVADCDISECFCDAVRCDICRHCLRRPVDHSCSESVDFFDCNAARHHKINHLIAEGRTRIGIQVVNLARPRRFVPATGFRICADARIKTREFVILITVGL